MSDRHLVIAVRLSPEERAALTTAALQRDEKPSAYARRLILDGLRACNVESTTPAANVDRRG
jgi:hypothetical protein